MSVPAVIPSPIAIAGFKDVYQVLRVEDALTGLQELGASASEALRATYVKMIRSGGQRFVTKPAALPDIDALINELPNFEAPLQDIRKQLALCLSSDDPLGTRAYFAAGRTGHRQDALRAPSRKIAWYRLQLYRHELTDCRLDSVRSVGPVEKREARQSVRRAGQRRLRQPGDRRR